MLMDASEIGAVGPTTPSGRGTLPVSRPANPAVNRTKASGVRPSTSGFGFVLCNAKCTTLTVCERVHGMVSVRRSGPGQHVLAFGAGRWRMKPRTILTLLTALVVVLMSDGAAVALDESAAWGQVPSPNRGTRQNELAGLAVVGSDDIWAVGRYNSGRQPTETGRDTLALHWDGTRWVLVRTPNPSWSGADFFTLEDADAVSSTEVWAVGYAEDFASLKSTTLVERWNGSKWKIVPSHNPGGSDLPNTLAAIAVAAPNDIWAVGSMGYPEGPLILRWNGSRWRSKRNACGVSLYGVHAVSPTDVWAVGDSTTCHYNGTRWSIIPSPQPRGQYNEIAYVLTDVSSIGPGDVWASGYRVIEQGEYLAFQSIV